MTVDVRRAAVRPLSAARWAPLAVAVGAGVGAVRASSAHDLSIGYAELSLRLAVLTVTPGFALVLAGAVCLMHRPAGVIGPVVGLLAVAWLSSTWIGWHAAPSVSRSAAELVAPFLVPALFHVAVVAGGRSPTRTERWVVGALYAGTAAGSVLLALSREPYTDQSCWANCTTNVFLVQSHPSLAHVVVNAERALELSGCVALVAVAIARGLSGAARSRGESAVVVLPAAVVAVAEAARIVQIHRLGHEDPLDRGLQLSFTVAAAGLAVLAAGLVASVVRATRTRAAIDRAMTEFGGAPRAGSVEQALRAALGDGSLQIAYRMPGAEGYVDEAGHILALPAASVGRPLTNVTRQGEVIAAILCERETAEHLRTLRGALVLGLENERLQASVLARLEDLRSSRARIVAASDEARSRLERDLHDGAQQHLLALSFDLRLALAAAQRGGDDEAARHVGQALSLTERALSELRDLAHGIFPAVVATGGLDEALITLASSAAVAVVLDLRTQGPRLPPAVAHTGYFTARLALDDASSRGAATATLSAAVADDKLTVTIVDDGEARASDLVAIEDRVGALGGRVAVGPRTCEAVIPCA